MSRPEDEDKAKKSESIVSKLKVLLMCTENELDVTNENCEIMPAAPELAPEFEEIVRSKVCDASKAEELQAVIEASFADNSSLSNLSQPKSAVAAAKSIIVFPKASTTQLLKGKFQTQPANALIKDSATFGPLGLLYQNNVGNKADILRDQEDVHDAEEAQNVPDSQCSNKKATVEVIGSMASLSDVLGLMANILHLVVTLIKLIGGRPKPILYSVIMYLFNFCSANPFQIWAIRHKDSHPHLHVYLFTLVQHVWIAFAQTAALPFNLMQAKTNSFCHMSTDYIRSAISEVATAVRDFSSATSPGTSSRALLLPNSIQLPKRKSGWRNSSPQQPPPPNYSSSVEGTGRVDSKWAEKMRETETTPMAAMAEEAEAEASPKEVPDAPAEEPLSTARSSESSAPSTART